MAWRAAEPLLLESSSVMPRTQPGSLMRSSRSPFTSTIRVRSIPPSYPGAVILSVESVNLESTDVQGRRSVNRRRRISTPDSLRTVLRRVTFIPQIVGIPSITRIIMSSERSKPFTSDPSTCAPVNAIQETPTTAAAIAAYRTGTDRLRISRPSEVSVVHPRSDLLLTGRLLLEPPEAFPEPPERLVKDIITRHPSPGNAINHRMWPMTSILHAPQTLLGLVAYLRPEDGYIGHALPRHHESPPRAIWIHTELSPSPAVF